MNLLSRSGRGSTTKDVRRVNQAVVLRRLFFHGPLSRQDLVAATRLSAGTVTNVVAGLIKDGLVLEAGTEDSDGGRPRVLLEVARNHGFVIGVEIDEATVLVEAFDLKLTRVVGSVVPIASRDPDVIADVIATAVGDMRAELSDEGGALLGVGVGVSGIVDQGPDPLVHARAFGWDDVPLHRLLSGRLGVPVLVENAAKALGQAELWFGAARGYDDAVVVLLGTGVGAGLFVDGQLYRGAHSSAGEFGHASINVGGRRCRCGATGCLEAYVGGYAIADRWLTLTAGDSADAGATRVSESDAVSSFLAAVGRDERADALMSSVVEELGSGLGMLINMLNPQVIVMQGWVGLAAAPVLLNKVKAATQAHALSQPWAQVTITVGDLGHDAGPLGAAALVVDGILVGSRGDAGVSRSPSTRGRLGA